MTIYLDLLIALGLAMDAFAVSITNALVCKRVRVRHAVKIATYCGVFQTSMIIIGYLLGTLFMKYIESVDHWVAFVVLTFIGGRMVYSSFKKEDHTNEVDRIEDEDKNGSSKLYGASNLTMLAFATSIDALVVGISIPSLTRTSPYVSSIVIGVVAFTLSFIGTFLGKKIGSYLKDIAEPIGGVVLICIAIKMLLEGYFGV